jgi:hypothetical protein
VHESRHASPATIAAVTQQHWGVLEPRQESVSAREAKLSDTGEVRPGVVLSVLDWRLCAGDALLLWEGLSPRGTRRRFDLGQIILRRRLAFGIAERTRSDAMSGQAPSRGIKPQGAGCVEWACHGFGRPTRSPVTIGGELGSRVASATNSSAISAKPTAARKARAGIATLRMCPHLNRLRDSILRLAID